MASTFRERRLPPAEVRRILRRAVEIAETDPETGTVERPLTEDELVRRAAELGLPESAVKRAIAAPGVPEPSGGRPWFSPRTVTLEHEIPGELPAERHEEIVEAIRAAAGTQGRTEVLGKTLTWSLGPTAVPLVTLRSRDGRTHVRVEERLNGAALLLSFSTLGIFPSLIAGAVTMDASRSGPLAWAVGAVTMVCAVLVCTLLATKSVRRREAVLERVMERTAAAVAAAVTRTTPETRARVAAAPERGAGSSAELDVAQAEAEAEAAEIEAAAAKG